MATTPLPIDPTSSVIKNLPPNQDIRPYLQRFYNSSDQIDNDAGAALNTVQEHLDGLSTSQTEVISYLNSLYALFQTLFVQGGYIELLAGTNFTIDIGQGHTQVLPLIGDATINAPTGLLIPGDELVLILVQDSVGGHQATWDAMFHFPGVFGLDPTANTATVFVFRINSAFHCILKSPPVTNIQWP